MKHITLFVFMLMGLHVMGDSISKETRYQIYAMTATEEQMADETWKLFCSNKSSFRKLAIELLQIDVKRGYNHKDKQSYMQKVEYLERELLKRYNEGLKKIKKVRRDSLTTIDNGLLNQYREAFFRTIKDDPKMREVLGALETMIGSSADFTEWYIRKKSGAISNTVKRHIKWGKLSEQEKVNWIYRYAFMRNLMDEKAQNSSAERKRNYKRCANPQEKKNENGRPPIRPLKINRKAIGS
jgi:hypothetical protein